MLSLLKPRCPVDVREKVWTELRMQWLSQRFGLKRLRAAAVVQPSTEFFPDPASGDAADAERVFQRVCEYMAVPPSRFELAVKDCCQDGACCPQSVSDDHVVIELGADDLADRQRLVSRMARAVAGQLLLDGGHMQGVEGDFDSVTDLLAVFLGFGVFQANAAVRTNVRSGAAWEYFSIRGAGCLQPRVPGYAMALMAWIRGETNPQWARPLGADAGSAFQRGYKYVTKTKDCLFRPENAERPAETRSQTAIVDDLARGTETQQLASIWTLMEHGSGSPEAMKLLGECVMHRNPVIQAEAARAVAAIGPDALPALPGIVERLSATEADTRAYCALAIGSLKPPLDACPDGLEVGEELSALLEDRNPQVSTAALSALGHYGLGAEPYLRRVVPGIVRLARDCEFGLLTNAVQQVANITKDPHAFFSEHLEDTEAELRERVLAELDSQSTE